MRGAAKGARPTARELALRLLARRSLSERELRARLEKKGYAPSEIDDALQLMISYHYIDDIALADAACREAERTEHGPLWVTQTLARRGLSEAACDRALANASAGATTRARELCERRFGAPTRLDAATRHKALRFLLGRGFTPECALDVVGSDL